MKNKENRFKLPVIGHFADKDVRFDSIIQAEELTGISRHLIFENIIGKIKSAKNTQWEYEDGKYWIKYKSQYIVKQNNYMRLTGFNG